MTKKGIYLNMLSFSTEGWQLCGNTCPVLRSTLNSCFKSKRLKRESKANLGMVNRSAMVGVESRQLDEKSKMNQQRTWKIKHGE